MQLIVRSAFVVGLATLAFSSVAAQNQPLETKASYQGGRTRPS